MVSVRAYVADAPANVLEARAWIAAWKARSGAAPAAAAAKADVPANVIEARQWIAAWKARQAPAAAPAAPAPAAAAAKADVPANVIEARQWIAAWKAGQAPAAAPAASAPAAAAPAPAAHQPAPAKAAPAPVAAAAPKPVVSADGTITFSAQVRLRRARPFSPRPRPWVGLLFLIEHGHMYGALLAQYARERSTLSRMCCPGACMCVLPLLMLFDTHHTRTHIHTHP